MSHVVRYVKGRLIERPLCIVRYIGRQVWKLSCTSKRETKPDFLLPSLYFWYVVIWHGTNEVSDKKDEGLEEFKGWNILVEVDPWG
ncbi:hypothetical protein DSO57_1026185 [Entomophthora muscae]|uniref:Uncharacterized protein n=1 Tax=Entomophthora muscae TaxID=34485 RepID=A0ACC2RT57_9FUNG|nr:hypothetical protein DSO57_1026185 [Entomophthora muscae]